MSTCSCLLLSMVSAVLFLYTDTNTNTYTYTYTKPTPAPRPTRTPTPAKMHATGVPTGSSGRPCSQRGTYIGCLFGGAGSARKYPSTISKPNFHADVPGISNCLRQTFPAFRNFPGKSGSLSLPKSSKSRAYAWHIFHSLLCNSVHVQVGLRIVATPPA